jgi:protein SCO1/2
MGVRVNHLIKNLAAGGGVMVAGVVPSAGRRRIRVRNLPVLGNLVLPLHAGFTQDVGVVRLAGRHRAGVGLPRASRGSFISWLGVTWDGGMLAGRSWLVFLLALVIACGLAPLRADSLTPIAIAQGVRFDQNLGVQVPLDLPFVSDAGKPVRLGDYFHGEPVLLVLDYYRCPNLCGIVLGSLVSSLKDLTWNAGEKFQVVVVSIDPSDTPRMSEVKKLGYVDRYERPATADGWHFLTGSRASIKTLADTVGFHFVYDPTNQQYAHPSGMIVLTPQGKTSRYFFGIEFPPAQIRDAIMVAAASKVNSPVYDFLLLCCSYNPLQGKYGVLIFNLMRAAGVLMVVALGGYVVHAIRTDPARRGAGTGGSK